MKLKILPLYVVSFGLNLLVTGGEIGLQDFSGSESLIDFSNAIGEAGNPIELSGVTFASDGGNLTVETSLESFFGNFPSSPGYLRNDAPSGIETTIIVFSTPVNRVGFFLSTFPATTWKVTAFNDFFQPLGSTTVTMPGQMVAVFAGLEFTENIARLAIVEIGGGTGFVTLLDELRFEAVPSNLSENTGFSFQPRIAVDIDDNVNVVWADRTSGKDEVLFVRSENGGVDFSPPISVSASQDQAFDPWIAVNDLGDIYVVWTERLRFGNIFFSRSTDGGRAFSAPSNISATPGTSGRPQITVDQTGLISVIWQDSTAGPFNIFYSRSSDGGLTFSSPTNLSMAASRAGNAQLVAASDNSVNVVWEDFASSNFEVMLARSTDGGVTFGPPQNISSTPAASVDPVLAVDGSGGINVAWGDFSGTSGEVLFTGSGDGGMTFSIPQNISGNPGLSFKPKIALDGFGNINIIWEDETSGNREILFSRSVNQGLSFSPQLNVSMTDGFSSLSQMALDQDGIINVIWRDETLGNLEIFLSRSFDNGGTFTTPDNISANLGDSNRPEVASDQKGAIHVVWDDESPGNFDVFYQNRQIPLEAAQALETVEDTLRNLIDQNPGTDLADKLQDALNKVGTAQDELAKSPPDRQAALGNLEGAAGDLEAAVSDGLISADDAAPLFGQIANTARSLALEAIDEAITGGGDENIISEAQLLLIDGDAAALDGQFKSAVAVYKDALSKAEGAL